MNQLYDLYENKKLHELINSDWGIKIGPHKCNILHIIAFNLDKDTFDILKKINQNKIYKYINETDDEGLKPIDYAKKSIKKNNLDYGFINYMINELNSKPINITDLSTEKELSEIFNYGYSKSDNSDNTSDFVIPSEKNTSERMSYVKNLNNKTIESIIKLTKLLDSDSLNKKSNENTYYNETMRNENDKTTLDLVEGLIDKNIHYFNQSNQINRIFGGDYDYSSSSESEDNNYDSSSSEEELTSFSRQQFDSEALDKYNELLKILMDTLKIDDLTARVYRALIKYNLIKENPDLKKNHKLRDEKVEEIIKNKKELTKIIKKIKEENKKDIEEIKEKIEARKNQKKSDKKKTTTTPKKKKSDYINSEEITFSD